MSAQEQHLYQREDITEEHSFDELARVLVEGSISRSRMLKLASAALLGGALSILASPNEAHARRRRKKHRRRRMPPLCASSDCSTGCTCPTGQRCCNGTTCAQCCADTDCNTGNESCLSGSCVCTRFSSCPTDAFIPCSTGGRVLKALNGRCICDCGASTGGLCKSDADCANAGAGFVCATYPQIGGGGMAGACLTDDRCVKAC